MIIVISRKRLWLQSEIRAEGRRKKEEGGRKKKEKGGGKKKEEGRMQKEERRREKEEGGRIEILFAISSVRPALLSIEN